MTLNLIARWEATPGKGQEVALFAAELAARSNAEDGCLRYEIWRDEEEGHEFVLVETYRDEAALESHRASTHFQELVLGAIVPLLKERSVKMHTAVVPAI